MAKRPDMIRPEPTNGQRVPRDRSAGNAAAADAEPELEDEEQKAADGVKLLLQQFRELVEYVSYYATVRIDGAKLSLRDTIIRIVSGALGFVVLAGLIIAASCYALSGIAEGLAVLFGGRMWAGNIVAGLLVIAGLAFGIRWLAANRKRNSRERATRKCEDRQARQKASFGHCVSDRAAEAGLRRK